MHRFGFSRQLLQNGGDGHGNVTGALGVEPGETSHSSSDDDQGSCGGADAFVLGVAMTLAGAALLAVSMVTQRYALTYPTPKVPLLCVSMPRSLVWFVGLLLYGAANALKIMAQPYGAWAVLSSVWTTLLVWNLVFARLFLRYCVEPGLAQSACSQAAF